MTCLINYHVTSEKILPSSESVVSTTFNFVATFDFSVRYIFQLAANCWGMGLRSF